MARRDPVGIRLLTRNGNELGRRGIRLIVDAVNRLKARSCLIDGEAVACDVNGVAVFQHLRRKLSGKHVFLFAFDLLQLDGEDLLAASHSRRAKPSWPACYADVCRACASTSICRILADMVFRHACKMGLDLG